MKPPRGIGSASSGEILSPLPPEGWGYVVSWKSRTCLVYHGGQKIASSYSEPGHFALPFLGTVRLKRVGYFLTRDLLFDRLKQKASRRRYTEKPDDGHVYDERGGLFLLDLLGHGIDSL